MHRNRPGFPVCVWRGGMNANEHVEVEASLDGVTI